ncbi:hypothetical protein Leryth_015843 [Lithospermum erythrorhizon]|nr:hypothetical protein Leryth_015843 [Lithospermum erythrorhizon]
MSLIVQSNQRGNNRFQRPRSNGVQAAGVEWIARNYDANTATETVVVSGGSTGLIEGRDQENGPHWGSSSSSGDIGHENGRSRQQSYKNRGRWGGSRSNSNQGEGIGRPMYQMGERDHDKEKRKGKGDDERSIVAKGKDRNLPPLVQEIQEKLLKNAIECMICYDMVQRSAPIWSCSSCFSIFHLSCVKKWAKAPTSVDLSAEKNQGFNWRCPGCQSVQLTSSKEIRYVCFCGKMQDPSADLYLTPHSCGEPCGKPLEKAFMHAGKNNEDICPHVCVLQCHPGPCPPCKAFAAPRKCPCGKKVITTRCSDRKSGLTCGDQCDKILDCGHHKCEQNCHVGPCSSCKVLVDASCFCMKKSGVIYCGDMKVKKGFGSKDGVFSCDSICGKELDCRKHECRDTCHPGPCGECDLLPSKIMACCCGKTSLKEVRQSCVDPVPTCSEICGKMLPCKLHYCQEVCHAGNCAPCPMLVSQKCRCGSTSRTIECFRTVAEDGKFTCDKPCGQKKTCGRHRCSERCCRLSNPRNPFPVDWDPHVCSIPCGKKLRCGKHFCESLCHSGHCPPCLETSFSDLTCACGRTSIPPPVPCGTPLPSCQYPCSVSQPCGHQPTHSCHFGDCPPCTVPVAKECSGGHVILRNIPCGSKEIKCNQLCGKLRQCGLHACAKSCHSAPCDSSLGSTSGRASCGQACGAPRRECRHTCASLCHLDSPCPDVRCEFPVNITCSCGRITVVVPCDAGGGYNVDTLFEATVIKKFPVALQPVEANGTKVPLGLRKLMCDDECAKLKRQKALANAFGITTPNLDALRLGENAIASQVFSDLFRRDPKWVLSVEERCKYLVLGKGKGGVNALRVHVFCPMLKEKRDVVKFIAERWKLTVNTAGWEPKRFVVVHVTPQSKAPARMLGVKGCSPGNNMVQSPIFDPLVDMDPRLVVALFDLPRDADISALVLRFGGECELVWLNDKNALTVFSDPVRAATATRRLDQGSAYYGAAALRTNSVVLGASSSGNPWGNFKLGSEVAVPKMNPRKKAVGSGTEWAEESAWGVAEWIGNELDVEQSVWKDQGGPVTTSVNRWNVLDSETTSSSTTPSAKFQYPMKPGGVPLATSASELGPGGSSLLPQQAKIDDDSDVVDDWEEAYD